MGRWRACRCESGAIIGCAGACLAPSGQEGLHEGRHRAYHIDFDRSGVGNLDQVKPSASAPVAGQAAEFLKKRASRRL